LLISLVSNLHKNGADVSSLCSAKAFAFHAHLAEKFQIGLRARETRTSAATAVKKYNCLDTEYVPRWWEIKFARKAEFILFVQPRVN